jgi:hypothetical protein
MSKKILAICLISITALLSGCANHPGTLNEELPRNDDFRFKKQISYFKPVNIDSYSIKYQQKTKDVIIIDDSMSTDNSYRYLTNKFHPTDTYKNLVNSLPKNIDYKIKTINLKQNSSNLADIFKRLPNTLNHEINKSVIILTAWKKINPETTRLIKKTLYENKNLCIYIIGLGNIHQKQDVVNYRGCGQTLPAEQIMSPGAMSNFIISVFYSNAFDFDGDGIENNSDRCPNTIKNIPITWDGCPRDSFTSNPRYQISKSGLK